MVLFIDGFIRVSFDEITTMAYAIDHGSLLGEVKPRGTFIMEREREREREHALVRSAAV